MPNHETRCPNCQHDQHLPGTECGATVGHGPNRWHLCLCLARPGAALPCPPQMTCQGGTLGYADVWYLQQGHSLSSADGVISPEVLGPVAVGFPTPDAAAPAAVSVPPPATRAADRAAIRDRIRRAVCEAEGFGWDTDMLEPDEYGDVADAVLAVLPEPADQAAVLNRAADFFHGLSLTGTAVTAREVETELRRLAAEAQQPDDGEGDELVCVDECGFCDACGYEPFGTPAEGWREAARFLRRTARDSGNRQGALHGARLIEAELRRIAEEAVDDPQPVGPCVAGEQQNETPEARRCVCPHPADEHSVYGCVDGCGCEWMPKRPKLPPMDPVHILGIEAQAETVHACPPDGSGLTPCCGRTPFELPRTDRISSEPDAVTCVPAVVAQPGKET